MNLMEEFMVASINEKTGNLLNTRGILTYGLAGIALYELLNTGRLSFDGKYVTLNSSSRTGDIILDEAIDFLYLKQKSYKTTTLLVQLSHKVKRLSKRILEGLEDNGVIKIEQKRFLGLIPYDRYAISRTKEYRKLVSDIKSSIKQDSTRAEPQFALLISILSACDVLQRLFDRNEKKQVRIILGRIRKSEYFETLGEYGTEVHKAIKQAVAAAHAAAAAAS